MIKVECNGGVHEFSSETTVGKVIKKVYGKKSGAIAALVNDEEKDLSPVSYTHLTLPTTSTV